MAVESSILTSIKKMLNVAEADESFDQDIIIHINSAFSTLNDLGVGPQAGFAIEDKEMVWDEFVPNDADNMVQHQRIKTYVYLKTRLIFDPPTLPPVASALQAQLDEVTWRILVKREETDWIDPDPPSEDALEVGVIDGGDPSGE